MNRGLERYVAEVLRAAELHPTDEREVREELFDHAAALASDEGPLDSESAYALARARLGEPARLGEAIAGGKGRLRTYWKKEGRRMPAIALCALVLALLLRAPALALVKASTEFLAPICSLTGR
ncbi:MAG: hypothetical protein HY553_16330 [Elusimicrobia bacterium]|nr:hypothetical protein [Elusimicrobiota bacterium]